MSESETPSRDQERDLFFLPEPVCIATYPPPPVKAAILIVFPGKDYYIVSPCPIVVYQFFCIFLSIYISKEEILEKGLCKAIWNYYSVILLSKLILAVDEIYTPYPPPPPSPSPKQ